MRGLLAAMMMLLLVAACKKEATVPAEEFSAQDTQREKVSDVTLLYSDSAIVRVRVTGPIMLNHLDRSEPFQEFPSGIFVEFFSATGQKTSTLTAKYAIRYETRNLTIVRDSVVWRSAESEQLESTELTWDEQAQSVSTNKFVVITTPVDTIYSQGFSADQNFKNVRLRAIDGTMQVKELTTDPPPTQQ
ncbi:MAG: LPS export ABC transporter periplasmic protein LptC [Lewinellaceae bacterium]|nr:LPS export ABC transporter periplasmic protein LptC [Lewinellaceae bacterium]